MERKTPAVRCGRRLSVLILVPRGRRRDVLVHKVPLFGRGRFELFLHEQHEHGKENTPRRDDRGAEDALGEDADDDRRGGAKDGKDTKDILQDAHEILRSRNKILSIVAYCL